MRGWIPRPGLAVAASLIALVSACDKPVAKTKTIVRPVRTEVVQVSEAVRSRSFSGTSRAGVEAKLSFRVSGGVRALHVKVGDHVEKGQLIAELDPTDYKLQVQEAQASLANARAQARSAKSSYDRARKLYETRNASAAQLDQARAASESAAAQARSVGQRISLLRSQLGYTKLKAPSDGSIATVMVEVNENVQAGQAVVLLNAGGKPEVIAAVPEALIAQIEEGGSVAVKYDALPGKTLAATITEVGVSSGRTQTTFPVTVQLAEPDAAIRPGMSAEVTFTFGQATDEPQIHVSPVAVGEDRRGRHVFLLTESKDGVGTIRRVPVEVGEVTEAGIEITKGLEGGELLVTAGLRHIQDGFTAKLLPGAMTGGSAAEDSP